MTTRVLVAGGSGRLGTLVVGGLAARGCDVRVLTRDPQRAAHLIGDRVTVLTGNVRDPAALPAALAAVDVVVSAVHGFAGRGGGSPATVDRDGNGNLIRAAHLAGAAVVLVSVFGAGPESPFELFRMKHVAEIALRESGVAATIIRPTAFLELWIDLLSKTAGRSNRPLVFGRGLNPINFVSVRDVAGLVQCVVIDDTTRGQTFEIGGPENLTLTELARMVSASHGDSTNPRHVPRLALQVMADTVGRLRPALGRQVRAALVMDRHDMSFDSNSQARARFAELSMTSASDLLPA